MGARRGLGGEKGLALGIVLFVMVALSLLGVITLAQVNTSIDRGAAYRRANTSYYLAERGLWEAVGQLNNNLAWRGPLSTATYTVRAFDAAAVPPWFPAGTIATAAGNVAYEGFPGYTNAKGSNELHVVAVGTAPNQPPVLIEALGKRRYIPGGAFRYAIFSKGSLALGGNNRVLNGPIYSGDTVTISAGPAVTDGAVFAYNNVVFDTGMWHVLRSDVFANNNIDLTTQANMRVDGGSSVSNTVNVSGTPSNQVTGTITTGVTGIVPPPSYFDSNLIPASEFAVGTTLTSGAIVPPAKVQYTTADLAALPTTPGTVIFLQGNVRLTGTLNSAATYIITGDIRIDGNVGASAGALPAFIANGTGDFRGAGGQTIQGLVYANGNINGTGNTTVIGSVTTQGTFSATGTLSVTYQTPPGGLPLPGGQFIIQIFAQKTG